MCGIFGKLYFHAKKKETKLLRDCLEALAHRGPDDTGVFEDDRIFLGSKRLSILDLSGAGHMPMHSQNKKKWIVFNGEIFNYVELRKELGTKHQFRSRTDTEVVLRLYEELGPACLHKLRGMFAFAIWDTEKKELFIARDHLGKKPLKFYMDKDCLIFASELKAILRDPSIPRKIDPIAIDEFLTYQYVPSPRTGFKNLYKLEPAQYAVVKPDGSMVKKKYWEPRFLPKLDLSEVEAAELVIKELKNSVQIRLRSDVALGAHLSGGIDSSLIVAIMSKELNHPVRTFSVGFQEQKYNELPFAREVAKLYKTDHHEIMADANILDEYPRMAYFYEEPYADPSLLPTWILCRETKKEVTVALNGDGGDENFAGYDRYVRYNRIQQMRHIPFKDMLHGVASTLGAPIKLTRVLSEAVVKNEELYPKLFGYFGASEKDIYYTGQFKKVLGNRNPYLYLERYKARHPLGITDTLLYTDLQTYLPEDLLVKIDIAGMAHSLEVRSPFLDHTFVETAARLPERMKLHGSCRKSLLKKIARRYLPEKCVTRNKQGFGIPLEEWMRKTSVRETLEATPAKSLFHTFIKENKLHELLARSYASSRLTKEDASTLWLLFSLKTWIDVWFPS